MYHKRNPPQEPPCDTCMVDLMKENHDTINIFNRVRGQVITQGPDNMATDLNYQAIMAVMDLYGIKDKKGTFERVVKTFHHFQKKEGD